MEASKSEGWTAPRTYSAKLPSYSRLSPRLRFSSSWTSAFNLPLNNQTVFHEPLAVCSYLPGLMIALSPKLSALEVTSEAAV
jgi:hypothetical protein